MLLRPIVQDTLFPTVCYVAGPNELAYLGQLARVYDAFGVPMPLMTSAPPRRSLDSNAMRVSHRDTSCRSSRCARRTKRRSIALLEAQLPAAVETLDGAGRGERCASGWKR